MKRIWLGKEGVGPQCHEVRVEAVNPWKDAGLEGPGVSASGSDVNTKQVN